MKKYGLWIATISLLLAGCHTEALYNGTYPSVPTRWPDNVETCGITMSVFPRWQKVITWTAYPFVNGYQDVGGGGCGGRAHNERVVEMESDETILMGQMGMDHGSGGWNDYAVFYDFHMGPENDFKDDAQYIDQNYQYVSPKTISYPKSWTFNELIGKPNTIVINGLSWQHVLLYEFDSYYPDPSKPGIPANVGWRSGHIFPPPTVHTKHPNALSFVSEVYTLQIDSAHQMKVWAIYMRPVVQDAHWLEARRAMLRKLVDAVTVKSVTDAEVQSLRAKAAVQRRCYAGSVEACKQGGLRTDYAKQVK